MLDLYRIAPGALSGAQCRDALSAADTATLLMLGLRTDPHTNDSDGNGDHDGDGDGEPDGASGWLEHSISSRAEVHQATGMVVAQLEISATEALARLRGHAFAEQRLLIDVAHDVRADAVTEAVSRARTRPEPAGKRYGHKQVLNSTRPMAVCVPVIDTASSTRRLRHLSLDPPRKLVH